jgi:predicted amidohydrolase
VRIAGIQHDITWESPDENFERLAPLIAHAAGGGARLVLVSEMFSTGFSMRADAIAEPDDGASTDFLVESARKHGVWLGGSIPMRCRRDDRARNVFVLSSPDGVLTRYEKLHPFSYAQEHEHYAPGEELASITIDGCRVALFVCYDLRFANAFWTVAPDTDLYAVVANWPEARAAHWRALLIARAIENQAFVIGVNRVGDAPRVLPDGTVAEPPVHYRGDTTIIDPLGEVLATAAHTEAVVAADIDPGMVASVRRRFPFMDDRRDLP